MAGKLYEKAKRYYGKEGGWDKDQLKNIVAKNPDNLSAEEYKEITGEAYVAETKKTQLDEIQEAVEKSNEELRQEGAEALTEELLNMGVL